MWVKFDNIPTTGIYQFVGGQLNGTNTNVGNIWINNSIIRIHTNQKYGDVSHSFVANEWYQIGMVFQTNGEFNAIVNGEKISPTNIVAYSGTNNEIVIGSGAFNGYIDQVRIFDTALTADQVTDLYDEVYCAPDIVPTDYFNTVLYSGTSATMDINNVGFQPDLIWTKCRTNTYSNMIVDSVRGGEVNLRANTTGAEEGLAKTTFDAEGYNLIWDGAANSASFQASGETYVAWSWKAGGNTSTYNIDDVGYATASAAGLSSANGTTLNGASVNTAAGFSIINYETNVNGDNRPAHGLNQEPEMIIFKPYDTSSLGWYVMTKKIDGSLDFLFLNTTGAKIDTANNEFIDSTHFRTSFGTTWGSVIAYCFHSVDGYQKVGSYLGTAQPNNDVYTGFRPRWVMIKNTVGEGWNIVDSDRNPSNPANLNIQANDSAAESSTGNPAIQVDFDETGFSLVAPGGTPGQGQVNSNGVTYIYLAIA